MVRIEELIRQFRPFQAWAPLHPGESLTSLVHAGVLLSGSSRHATQALAAIEKPSPRSQCTELPHKRGRRKAQHPPGNDLEKPNVRFYSSAMVKVHDEGGFRVYVYSPPREHHPPHVHVECARGGEVIVRLGDDDTEPSLWQNHHMSLIDVRQAVRLVHEHQRRFLGEWMRLHG